MKNLTVCTLAAALLFPITALAESHAWTRDEEGNRLSARASTPLSSASQFSLSPSKLNLCSTAPSSTIQVEVTAAPGVDLIEGTDLDLRSLLAPAAFKANAALLSSEPGIDLTDPTAVKKLGQSARPAADVFVDREEVDLRLRILQGTGACGASNTTAGGLQSLVVAAESDSCSGSCDCTFCECFGSESCCQAGCEDCWEFRDDQGLCGPT